MKINVMFVHNSVPEYRIKFWKKLGEMCSLRLVITRKDLENKIYGLEKNTQDLDIVYWNGKQLNEISDYDIIVLPPVDTVREYVIGKKILNAARKNNVKVLLWTEKWTFFLDKKYYIKECKNFVQSCLIKNLANKADVCVAAGSRAQIYLQGLGIQSSKINIAYDSNSSPKCQDKIDFFREYGIPAEAKVILFLGRIIPRKGLLNLIKAFENYKCENTYLLVCGEGEYLEFCENYVVSRQIENVIFAGKIQPRVREAYYKRANVFVLPSYCYKGIIEAWGLTVNEALECGTPVIATNVVGAAYDLINDGCGKMITENSVEELLKALKDILQSNCDYMKNCKENAWKYSVENMAEEFYSIIKNCTEM